LALGQGDTARARAVLEEGLALYRTLRDERGTADALLVAGFVARVEEEYATAQILLDEALALSRAIRYPFITAAALHHLGMMAADARGDYAAAQSFLEESLALYRTLGVPRLIALVLCALGDVARAQGDHGRAREVLHEGLATTRAIGASLDIPLALDTVAHLAMDEGHRERAVGLAAAAASVRETMGTLAWPVLHRRRDHWLAAARAALGAEVFAAAWAEGKTNVVGKVSCRAVGGKTVVTVQGSATPSFTAYRLENPPRLVVDIANSQANGASDVAADTGVVLTLATAASQHQRVRLRYRSHADQDSERDLDPYGLVLHSGRWYVTGRDGKSGELRTFRVDRVSEALLSGVTFDPPPDFDPVQHVTRSLAAVPYAHEIEVVLATTLENAQRRIPPTVATLAETEGGVLLTGRSEHRPGLAAMLAGLGWPFTVRRPAALVTEVRALSDRLRAWSES